MCTCWVSQHKRTEHSDEANFLKRWAGSASQVAWLANKFLPQVVPQHSLK